MKQELEPIVNKEAIKFQVRKKSMYNEGWREFQLRQLRN